MTALILQLNQFLSYSFFWEKIIRSFRQSLNNLHLGIYISLRLVVQLAGCNYAGIRVVQTLGYLGWLLNALSFELFCEGSDIQI